MTHHYYRFAANVSAALGIICIGLAATNFGFVAQTLAIIFTVMAVGFNEEAWERLERESPTKE